MEIISIMPLIAIIVPIVGAFLLVFVPEKNDNIRNPLAMLISFITACLVVSVVQSVINGNIVSYTLVKILPGLDFSLSVDPLGALFGGLAAVLWVFAVLYSIGYMSHEHNKRRYFVFYLISLGVTVGIAFSANLFTLYLFYEMLTLATYPLVIHEGNKEAQAAGVRYMIYSFVGAGLVLFSLLITYGMVETLSFMQGGIMGEMVATSALLLRIVFITYILGFGVKAAIMPLHSWLPSAMAAPTPVSALLHAVAVVKSGVFGILRVMYSIYGTDTMIELNLGVIVLVLVSFTIILASIIAMRQDVLKRRLAYSTISQLGYISLGAALLTPLGLSGGLIHIINHALLKIILFFCAGAIITVTGKKKISELNGIGRRMPITMLAFTIGTIGMIGILPINGFISKWYIMGGSLEAGMPIFILILISSALLNAAYFIPIITAAFFKKGDFEPVKGVEAPLTMLLPIVVLSVICIVVGIRMELTVPFVESVVTYLF
ncbi:MAG: monovalent cation/H+ antiporter subunit D family protein [Bacillota bacterium]|nr:monovalent cation/H+ antiporter subunit D family protein [Bacillota bacterium]